jgi:hypothetical protein
MAKMSGWDRLGVLGATMRDTSHALRSEQSSYLSDYMAQIREKEEQTLQAERLSRAIKTVNEGGLEAAMADVESNPTMIGAYKDAYTLQKAAKGAEEPSMAEVMGGMLPIFGKAMGVNIPQGNGIQGLEDVKVDLGPVSGKLPKSEEQRNRELIEKKQESEIGISEASKKEQQKILSEKFGETARVIQAFRNLESYGKSMDNENLGTAEREIISKTRDIIPYLPTDIQNKYTPVLNYVAQQEETKIGALPILSGQARYVVDLARAIDKTIPSPGLSQQNRQNLIAQSIRNQMSLIYGVQNGFLNAENLVSMGINPNQPVDSFSTKDQSLLNSIQLTPEQEKSIEEAINYVMESSPLKMGKQVKEETQIPEMDSMFNGQKVINIKRIE